MIFMMSLEDGFYLWVHFPVGYYDTFSVVIMYYQPRGRKYEKWAIPFQQLVWQCLFELGRYFTPAI